MIHIEFEDYSPEQMLLEMLSGWVVNVNDECDILVTGTNTDEHGFRLLCGEQCDDEGVPLVPTVEREFPAEGITIVVY